MKNISLARIRQVFPQFNRRPLTENDLWRACKKFGIIVKDDMPLAVDGYHERKNGRYYIIINQRLRGSIGWLHTAFHEFCHFLFDVPDHRKNYVMYRGSTQEDAGLGDEERRRKESREKWADAFATVCIMPWREVERISKEASAFDDLALLSLCRDRIAVHNDFNL